MEILFCEDKIELLTITQEILLDEIPDAKITCFSNAIESKEAITNKKFDFIISDYNMNTPGGNGDVVYKDARGGINGQTPFIMYSSESITKFLDYIDSDQNFEFISKDSSFETVLKYIQKNKT